MQGPDDRCGDAVVRESVTSEVKMSAVAVGIGCSNHPLGTKTFRLDRKDENNTAKPTPCIKARRRAFQCE